MIRPVRMQKVMLLATKSCESRLISALHRFGAMQVNALDLGGLEKGRPLVIYDEISKELVRVRSILGALSINGEHPKPGGISEPEYERALSEARSIKIDDRLKELSKEKSDIQNKVKEQEKRLADISRLSAFPALDFSRLTTRTFTFALGAIKKQGVSKLVADLEEYLKGDFGFNHAKSGKETELLVVFYPKRENIDFLLSRYGFERIALPEGFTSFSESKAALESQLQALKASLKSADDELASLRSEYLAKVARLEKELSILSARASIASRFASGRRVVAMSGWVKKSDTEKLQSVLEEEFGGETELIKVDDEHGAPIVLDNPKNLGPFQFLVEFYGLPSYSELDPTFILLFTVPITYGMILGDVGYGLISAVLAWLILRKFKGGMLGNVAKIWLFSSVASIFFGIMFDEWFGLTHLKLAELFGLWGLHTGIEHSLYHGVSRSHYLSLVLGLTIVLGVLQIALGFIIGAINAWGHDKKHAAAKIAWLFALVGGFVAVSASMFNLFPADYVPFGLGALVLAVPVIFWAEGLPGLFEIPGLAANTLSYARIAAAGVAGVIIAEIINEKFEPTPEAGPVILVVFILLHVLNAALAMFESIVQGGRLNLVEFYSKFFHGGGKAFEPFSMEGSQEENTTEKEKR